MFQPNKGEYVNVTTFVTSPPEHLKRDLQVIHQLRRVSFVCASTDGLEKLALENDQVYTRFFIPLEQYIQKSVNPEKDRDIEEFLNRDSVNKRTDDDKTILLCVDIEADPAPQISEATPKSQPPAPLPPTTTPPPSVKPKFAPSTPPPNVKPQQKSDPSILVDRNPSQLESKSETEMDESLSDTTKSGKKRKKKKTRILVGLFLFSNFLCMYFATVGAIYITERIRQNRPDLEWIINNQLSLGSLPTWSIWVCVILLCLYSVSFGMVAADGSNETDNNKNNRGSSPKRLLNLVVLFKPNIGEVFTLCSPFAAIMLAFLTAFYLNNTFPNPPKKIEVKFPSKIEIKFPSMNKLKAQSKTLDTSSSPNSP